MQDRHDALKPGIVLEGYRFERILGSGGFGITYYAIEDLIGRPVAIKEFLPQGVAFREPGGSTVRPLSSAMAEDYAFGLGRFRDEAKTLVALSHPNVVPVLRYFEANATGYLVMAFQEGCSLGQLLQRNKTLDENEIRDIAFPLLDGLAAIHARGFLHRDVKPDNIFIRADRTPVLLDFGAARQALIERSKSLTAIVTPGYAPVEQYEREGRQGAWTDIYAVGAVLYRCVAGSRPPDAPTRISARFQGEADPMRPAADAAVRRYSPVLLAAIDAALALDARARPQSAEAMGALLRGERAAASPGADTTLVADGRHAPKPRKRRKFVVAVATLLILVGGGAFGILATRVQQHGNVPRAQPEVPKAEVERRTAEERRAEREKRRRAEEDGKAEELLRPGQAFRDCPECPEMVVIPTGTFTMGSPETEKGRNQSESPQHLVTIAQPFALGKYTVTFAEWDACVDAGGCEHKSDNGFGRGNRPVIGVSWEDAQQYVMWLSRKSRKKYRLPSEAEWEYAARAGTTTAYHWGPYIGRNNANCDGCGSSWDAKQTAPVGSFPPNGWGLHDMHGNVWQWVEDCWNDSYIDAPQNGSAWTSSGECGRRVLRGGSWDSNPDDVRAAVRNPNFAGLQLVRYGFRVARSF